MPEAGGRCEKARDPRECTPGQIRECHGEVGDHPCETQGCEQDKNPGDCSDEQIRECHGDVTEHPCAES